MRKWFLFLVAISVCGCAGAKRDTAPINLQQRDCPGRVVTRIDCCCRPACLCCTCRPCVCQPYCNCCQCD